MTTEQRDWAAWHEAYRDDSSPLSQRLEFVRGRISAALDCTADRTYTAVSLCAGQGDDLLGVLSEHPSASNVRARLVELNADNVAVMRARAAQAGLHQLQIVQGDAADTRHYEGAVPADLVLVCGIFGNISDDDIFATIRAMPQFCASGATLIWTRSRRPPDQTGPIRQAFAEAGFRETEFFAPDDLLVGAGSCQFEGQPEPLVPGRLFTFVH